MILALDTSSAAGSAAVLRDGAVVVERAGDGTRTHAERLPRELMAVLDAAGASLREVDQFAVCTGPGSFTGLRVGIATIQGLALAQRKLVVPVSAFEALAASLQLPVSSSQSPVASSQAPASAATAVWIDGHRGEVFATLFGGPGRIALAPNTALPPSDTIDQWRSAMAGVDRIAFIGEGAIKYREIIAQRLGARADVRDRVPLLAGTVARLAADHPDRAVRPHAVAPLYVRRPDVEIKRDRARPEG